MTFDDWYEQALVSTDLKENMRMAWSAALQHGLTPQLVHGRSIRKGDTWTVRVKGGTQVSEVVILQMTDTIVVIEDPPKASYHWRRGPRKHLIENLEFLNLVCRAIQ